MFRPSPSQIISWVAKNFPNHRSRKGSELMISNPLGDSGHHLQISTTKGLVHDWRPGYQQYDGSFLRFVQQYRGISFSAAIKEVCGGTINIRDIFRRAARVEEPEEPNEIVDIKLPSGARPLWECDGPIFQIAKNYLSSRGITARTIQQWRLHSDGTNIVFPYYEYDGLVYFQTRDILNKRFSFPDERTTELHKSDFIYGFDMAEPFEPIILVESPINALSIGPGTLATGGADMTGGQVKKLKLLAPSLVILAPDGDKPGVKSMRKNFFLLQRAGFTIHYVLPIDADNDWNDMLQSGNSPSEYIKNNHRPLNISKLAQLTCQI